MAAEFDYYVWADCWVAPGASFAVYWADLDPTKMRWFDTLINASRAYWQSCSIARVKSYLEPVPPFGSGRYFVEVTVANGDPFTTCSYSIMGAEAV